MTAELKPFSEWQHYNGCKYLVLFLSNEEGDADKYPTTVVYQNVDNGKRYSRPLSDWHRSLIWVRDAVAPEAPPMTRYEFSEAVGTYVERPDGEYVLHSQAVNAIAAEQINTKDALELADRMDRFAQTYLRHKNSSDAAVEDLTTIINYTIDAWESTPAGNTTTRGIERWLIDRMKPAIDACCKAINRKVPEA